MKGHTKQRRNVFIEMFPQQVLVEQDQVRRTATKRSTNGHRKRTNEEDQLYPRNELKPAAWSQMA